MKTAYISPKVQILEARPMTALLSSGGLGINGYAGGATLNYDGKSIEVDKAW